jgi:hypothetical protein
MAAPRLSARYIRQNGLVDKILHNNRLNSLSRHLSSSSACSSPKQLAFAFDIDGVLKAGGSLLPGARQALTMLEGNNRLKKKVPYIFVTNGGGSSEKDRAAALSREFDLEVRFASLSEGGRYGGACH